MTKDTKRRGGNQTPRRYKGGRPIREPQEVDEAAIIAAIRAHLDAKPAKKLPVLLARQILTLLERRSAS